MDKGFVPAGHIHSADLWSLVGRFSNELSSGKSRELSFLKRVLSLGLASGLHISNCY